jgi:hypothetical protein
MVMLRIVIAVGLVIAATTATESQLQQRPGDDRLNDSPGG